MTTQVPNNMLAPDVALAVAAAASAVAAAAIAAALPAGIMVPYGAGAAPAGWLLCNGQAVSRTGNAALFAAIGTTFGVGDGSTTFNVPDMRGRVVAGEDDMGGTPANVLNVTLTGTTTNGGAAITGLSSTAGLAIGMLAIGGNIPAGRTIASIDSATQVTLNSGASVVAGTGSIRFGVIDGATLGATGGSQVHTLTTPQMPAHTHAQTGQNGGAVSAGAFFTAGSYGAVAGTATQSTGGGQAHPNVQPTLIAAYIIKT